MAVIEVIFEDVWLCDVSDPVTTVTAHSPTREHSAALDGEVRYYAPDPDDPDAGARARVMTSGKDVRSYPLTLTQLTVDQVALLESWRGRVVLLRDGLGRRVFGTYLTVETADQYLVGGWRSVSKLVVTAVSHDESV